jgi:hypothetical protein
VAAQKTFFVLSHEGAGACAKHRNLLLNLLYVIFARLEVNLWCVSQGYSVELKVLTCLIATISPVALSMALYTTPKLPPGCISAIFGTATVVDTYCPILRVLDIDWPQIRPACCTIRVFRKNRGLSNHNKLVIGRFDCKSETRLWLKESCGTCLVDKHSIGTSTKPGPPDS